MLEKPRVRAVFLAGAFAAGLVGLACGGPDATSTPTAPPAVVPAAATAPSTAATKAAPPPVDRRRRAEQIARIQESGLGRYPIDRVGRGRYRALRTRGFTAELTSDRLRLSAPGRRPAWRSELRVTGYGCGASTGALPTGAWQVRENRAARTRGAAVTEWYLNGPLGLEQGFTLHAPPAGCDTSVRLEQRVGGDLRPRVAADGRSASLHDRAGAAVLFYRALYVADADRREVPARLVLDGDHLVIAIETHGARFPLTVDPLVAVRKNSKDAPDGIAYDALGRSVGIADYSGTVIAGAPLRDDNGSGSGAAYVFSQTDEWWDYLAKLLPSDGAASDQFGCAVAIDQATGGIGDRAIVGAYQHDGLYSNLGRAYVFKSTTGAWVQEAAISPPDMISSNKYFGIAVDLDGDQVIVGASGDASNKGAAYFYHRSGSSWSYEAKVSGSDSVASDRFGSSVALAGYYAIIGAYGDASPSGSNAGSAYVFYKSGGTTWGQQAKLVASDRSSGDEFGAAVSISGIYAIVGAPGDNSGRGAAYIFSNYSNTWSQKAKLVASDGAAGDGFGSSVAIKWTAAGTIALVGATYDDGTATDTGAAYLYRLEGSSWVQQTRMVGQTEAAYDYYGWSVDLAATNTSYWRGAVGAPGDDNLHGSGVGIVHIYTFARANGDACTSDNQCSSQFCVNGYCCNSSCDTACRTCAATPGTCTNVTGADDPDTCTGAYTCSASALCRLKTGQVCTAADGSECASGYCKDGHCCNSACTAECRTCATGTCSVVRSADDDPECTGTKTCSASGVCHDENGTYCTSASTCASGICKDNRCCGSSCGGFCEACNVAGHLGTCYPIPSGGDPDDECLGTDTCGGTCNGGGACQFPGATVSCGTCKVCDGAGACATMPADDAACGTIDCDGLDVICRDYYDLTANRCKAFGTCKAANDPVDCNSYANTGAGTPCQGQSCTGSTYYPIDYCDGSGLCVDTPSQSCGLNLCNGSICGTGCSLDTQCVGTAFCNGVACEDKRDPGAVCGRGEMCTSGSCVDGVCCLSATCGTCQACNLAGSAGTCTAIVNAEDPDTCAGTSICNGAAACKLKNGQPCTGGPTTCASGVCADDLCCNVACGGLCEACDVSGLAGTCSPIPPGQDPGEECAGTGTCGGTCNGARACQFPGAISCGTCKVCDGAGACAAMPADDATCGTIDCDLLDTACRDYSDLTASRCKAFGSCKVANDPADCNVFANASPATVCQAAGCSDAVYSPADHCDGAGSCADAGTVSCGYYACAGDVCGTTCATSAECSSQAYCSPPNCVSQGTLGSPCQNGGECVSGNCVDGVCCASTSCETCRACNLSGSLGSCSEVRNADDDTCTGVNTCSAAGECLLKNGQSCSGGAATCASGVCADNLCCNSSCNGLCEACDVTGHVGTCTAIPAGQDPVNECGGEAECDGTCNGLRGCQYPDSAISCGTCKRCNGGGLCNTTPIDDPACGEINCDSLDTTCRDYQNLTSNRCKSLGVCKQADLVDCSSYTDAPPATVCQAASCTGATYYPEDHCAAGACVDSPSQSCAPYACSGTACGSTCGGDGDCVATAYCAGTTCVGRKSDGSGCGRDGECLSGHCVDAVCCGSISCSTCEACNLTGSLGSCSTVRSADDDTCTGTSTCDANGQCRLKSGQPCGSDGSLCATGSCADGRCCDSSCGGTCEACDLAGHEGTCWPIAAGADPLEECTGTGTCGGTCNGSRACQYPSQSVRCGTCSVCDGAGACAAMPADDPACGDIVCDGLDRTCRDYHDLTAGRCKDVGVCKSPNSADCTSYTDAPTSTVCQTESCAGSTHAPADYCDGNGACVDSGTESCGLYVCSGPVCLTSCTADGDCVTTAYCTSGACAPRKSDGSLCQRDGQCLSTHCVDGVCCDAGSCGTCQACNLVGTLGSCSAVRNGDDDTCTDASTCDANGECKLKNGGDCTGGATTCASGVCADDVCCNSTCAGLCETCNLPGAEGTCSAIPAGTDPIEECPGTGTCGGTCNGARGCQFPDSNIDCGTCQRCNGAGACASTPIDDDACGVIVCDGLDTTCRDYQNLTANRCKSFGVCKAANSPDCVDYVDAPSSTQCQAASCTGSTFYPADFCNAGVCVDTPGVSCGYYACVGAACATTCTDDGQCNTGAYCTSPNCVSQGTIGSPCVGGGECLSGNCVDHVCCGSGTCGECEACNLPGSAGACAPVKGADDDTCTGTQTCDPSGACKLKNGQSCSGGATTCASGLCADGLCCNSTCGALCEACDVAGHLGTCWAVPAGQDPAEECAGSGTCGGTCNGARACQFPASSVTCGTCQTCDSQGACAATPIDDAACGTIDCDDLDNPCRDYHDLTANRCKAFGECKAANSQSDCSSFTDEAGGTVCAVATCVGGSYTPPRLCDGGGVCIAGIPVSCGLYACAGAACGTSCAGDGDCAPGAHCAGTSCVVNSTNGSPCQRGGECASSYCVDGVCCTSESCGTCEACNLPASPGACGTVANADDDTCHGAQTCNALGQCKVRNGEPCTGGAAGCASGQCADGVCCNVACASTCAACDLPGSVGTCSFIGAGEDPADECTGTGTCGGTCNGAGGCQYPAGETECGAETCTGSTHTAARACTGLGACGTATAGPCVGGYVCSSDGATCLTSCSAQAHCQPTHYCDTAINACKVRSTLGTSCDHDVNCASGHCVDGVCCDSACDGRCEACNLMGRSGACSPVADGADPAEECAGTGTCGGVCDGQRGCRYPGTSTSCQAASCSDGVVVQPFVCDGAGRCVAGGTRFCGGYACEGDDCRTMCTRDDQCAPSWACDVLAGTCTGGLPAGSACQLDGQCQSGACAGGRCCSGPCSHQDATCGGACDASGTCSYPTTSRGCGTCQTCDGRGACMGTPPDDAACDAVDCSGLDDVCGAHAAIVTNRCRAFGQCKSTDDCAVTTAAAAGTPCGEAECVAEVELSFECDGAGGCRQVERSCLPYLCDSGGSACLTSCLDAGDCAAGRPCDATAGACRGLAGDACADDAQCQGGFCRDGVCCETACDGTCERCDLWPTAGTCAAVPAGEDPDEECAGTGACGGSCDGAGACQYPGSTTTCDLCTSCDGAGTCGAAVATDPECGRLACSALATECRTWIDPAATGCAAAGECDLPAALDCQEETIAPDGTGCECPGGGFGACQAGDCVCGSADGGVVDGGVADGPGADGPAAATDAPIPEGDAGSTAPPPPGGCGCRAAPSAGGLLAAAFLLPLLFWRRRRSCRGGGEAGRRCRRPGGGRS